ncbi:PilZ domain-containing protein [Thermodesulfobacteriota bacterium]
MLMQEKRKFRRVDITEKPEIYDAQSNKLLGNMVDISTDGFRMITNNQMKQGKEYLLNISLPAGNNDSKKVAVKAKVRWCSLDISTKLFASGFYLVEIEPKGRLDLAALMLNGGKPEDSAISEPLPTTPLPGSNT